MTGCCAIETLVGSTVLATSIYFIFKWRSTKNREEKQLQWNQAGKDVVVLHQFPRATYAPSASPYPLKLETFLRMHKINYINDFDEYKSAKGKSPWITFNGINVADSQLAIEFLCKKLDLDLDGHLSAEEKARARTIRSLIEDHLYFILAQDRWVHNEGKIGLTHFGKLPPVPTWLLKIIFRLSGKYHIGKQTDGQGLGRHTEAELIAWGIEDLKTLSILLGNKPYLMGNEPSLVDLTLFGFICMFLYATPDDNSLVEVLNTECVNLKEHNNRIKELFWPDWDKHCAK